MAPVVATTTYSYDANGNVVRAGGWSYMWDYLNRMLSSGFNNSTTTYYPNKYYSFTSTKSGANTYATSTNYVFNGDTLLATIDQPLYNGAATGFPLSPSIVSPILGRRRGVGERRARWTLVAETIIMIVIGILLGAVGIGSICWLL